jgi:hypothetical protein
VPSEIINDPALASATDGAIAIFAIARLPWGRGRLQLRERLVTASRDSQRMPDLIAGPKPVAPAASAKLSAMERFGTPLWIAVGLLVIGLAIVAAVN